MPQDATKMLLGATHSSDRFAEVYASDPASFPAGTACRLGSDGLLTLTKGSNRWVGISLGRSLSEAKKTSVLRAGSAVPILLELAPARGSVTITSYANLLVTAGDVIAIGATSFTAQSSSVTLGQATFRAATTNAATATSLAAQINAHATAGALVNAVVDPSNSARVLLTAKGNTTAGNAIILTYTDSGSEVGATVTGSGTLSGGGAAADYVTLGSKVYISDTSGKADDPSSLATVSDAVYVSAAITGIDEDGSSVAVALVDMIGGL